VLLFLFGSKDGLVRELLAKARLDELALLTTLRGSSSGPDAVDGLGTAVRVTWRWLADATHRPLLMLWCEAYARSLVEPDGAWAEFARQTVDDWLSVRTRAGLVERTLALAVLRGALLDLLATGDRTTAAVERHLATTRRAA
jgi:hypothetical protein